MKWRALFFCVTLLLMNSCGGEEECSGVASKSEAFAIEVFSGHTEKTFEEYVGIKVLWRDCYNRENEGEIFSEDGRLFNIFKGGDIESAKAIEVKVTSPRQISSVSIYTIRFQENSCGNFKEIGTICMPTKFIGTEMFNLSKFKHCTKGFELHYGGA